MDTVTMSLMQKFANEQDCEIVRNHPDWPASAVLFDCDGEVVNRFDESLTDVQIWAALEFANRAYNIGFCHGGKARATRIRRLLEA